VIAKKAHFIGICGVGMSATAKLLKDGGARVTGSDEGAYPPASDFLDENGIPYNTCFMAANLPPDADLIVIGKNAKLVPESNPEVESQPAPNGASHDPSFFIGAIPLTPPTSARLGAGSLFVLEGDEYPSSNTDPRSKFLHYHPRHLLVVPLAHDHFNVFPTPQDYVAPFLELVALPPPDGTILMCLDGPLSGDLMARLSRPVATYGLSQGDFHAADIVWGETTQFSLVHAGARLATIRTGQLGAHSIQNIVGVGAFLLSRNLMSPDRFAAAMASFKGIKRRLDRKSELTAIPIFEGFGSSYDKARSAIAAMRRHFPQRRLIVIFEPHTFSWRNREALHWYDDVFADADKVLIYEPPSQGAATHAQVSQAEILERVLAAGTDAEPIADPGEALRRIGGLLHPDDAILMLTSGHLGGLIERVPLLAERKYPRPAVEKALLDSI
jgi:UDP-N-acetylmuramate: L-alanyl-gamma-D-glutamyl-meso-diaminopimelate ligase